MSIGKVVWRNLSSASNEHEQIRCREDCRSVLVMDTGHDMTVNIKYCELSCSGFWVPIILTPDPATLDGSKAKLFVAKFTTSLYSAALNSECITTY